MDFSMPAAHSDETLVTLDANQIAVAKKSLSEISGCVKALWDDVSDGQIKVMNRYNVLGCLIADTERLGKAIGYEKDLAAEEEYTVNKLRAANQEIRELTALLANATPLDGLGELLHKLDKEVAAYWKSLGFLLADGHFEARYSANSRYMVKLSAVLDIHGDHYSETPVDEEEKCRDRVATMRGEGVLLSGSGNDMHFLDTPGNRTWLLQKMRARFPSFRVYSWDSKAFNHKEPDMFYIHHVEGSIVIKDLGAT